MNDRILILDTTLRDGEQSPGATMNLPEKLRLAHQLEVLGVDCIEAGFPASSPGDFEAVRAIAARIQQTEVAALARCLPADIDRAWEAIRKAARPRIHVFLATSPIHMEHKLRKSPDEVLELAVAGVRRAAALCPRVEFSAEDASRSDPDFLIRVASAVVQAGATIVNLPDTVGYATPEDYAALLSRVIRNTPHPDSVLFSAHCHNDLGLATANTLAAVRSGARQVEVTLCGIGERAGNAALEETVMALHVHEAALGLRTGVHTEHLFPSCRLLSLIIGQPIPGNKAIIGGNAFAHEAGIHQDGILKDRATYEIIDPRAIGRAHSELVIGKHSGRSAVRDKLHLLGYTHLSEKQFNTVFEAVKKLADKKSVIHDEDLEALIMSEVYRLPDRYRLLAVSVQSSTPSLPATAAVSIQDGDAVRRHAGFGVGPIDATFNVIASMLHLSPQLERYAVNAITGGTDAQGEVTVRLADGPLTSVGRGSDPDIIIASARAYVDALNRLAAKKRDIAAPV